MMKNIVSYFIRKLTTTYSMYPIRIKLGITPTLYLQETAASSAKKIRHSSASFVDFLAKVSPKGCKVRTADRVFPAGGSVWWMLQGTAGNYRDYGGP